MELNGGGEEKEPESGHGEGEPDLLWSWGAGTDGQLGTGILQDELLPRRLSLPLSSITAVSCGGAHVVVVTSQGRAFTWGRGSSGQLGQGEIVSNCLQPKLVKSMEKLFISNVSAGWSHSGFVSDTGRLFTCGDGSFGQLGHGDYESHCYPTEVSYFGSKHVEKIACGMRHSLVLLKGNNTQDRIYGFGACKRGQVGIVNGKTRSVNLPRAINGLEKIDFVSVIANGDHSAALSADGSMYYWGRGFRGAPDAHSPHHLDSSIKIKQAALGWNHAVMLTDGGDVYMLGGHQFGTVGSCDKNGSVTDTTEIVPQKVHERVVQVAAGAEHSALVTEDGCVKSWGWGEHGQLGLGDTSDQALPQLVNHVEWNPNAQVYCGSGFTLAVNIKFTPSLRSPQ